MSRDDDGNRFLAADGLGREAAERPAAEFEARRQMARVEARAA
ncbi:hypothetical protein [Kitasatospora sp. NBC_00315]